MKNTECEIIRESNDKFKPDYNFKIVIIGDSGVGKSCLAVRVTHDSFEATNTSTVGYDYFNFNVKINNKVLVNLKVWDTCGQERYRSLISSFYEKSSMAMIIYAINSKTSFNNIGDWIKQLKTNASPDCKIVLIGSKSDLNESREVTYEDGKLCQSNHQLEFFMETSSKTGFNVEELFKQAAILLYNEQVNNHSKNLIDPEFVNAVKLSKDSDSQKKKKCC